MKLFFVILLFPLKLFAQDITGVWTGSLYNDTTKEHIHYELAISEFNGKLSGYSHTTFIIDSIKNIGVKSVKIKKKDNEFFVEDERLIDNNYTEPPAKGVKTFITISFSENDSAEVLSGSWNTNRTKVYSKLTGSIFLEKKKKIKETLIVQKLEQMGLSNKLSFLLSEISSRDLVITNKKETEQNKTIPKSNELVVINKENVKLKAPEPIIKALEKNVIAVNKEKQPESTEKVLKEETKFKETDSKSKIKPGVAIKEAIKPKVPEKKLDEPAKEIAVVTEKEQTKLEKNLIKPDPLVINEEKSIIKKGVIEIPAAAEIATRKIETIRTVEISRDSLVFTLYDNGTVDGDTVSILINGKVIWPRVGLLATANNKTIYLTPEMGDSILVVMYAENLGSIPPNTGLLVVRDGEKDYEIRFSGDLQKNSAIILKRKKKN